MDRYAMVGTGWLSSAGVRCGMANSLLVLHGEEGSGRFNPTSYSPAAFLPVHGCAGIRQRCGGWAGCPAPAATERLEVMPSDAVPIPAATRA